MNHCEKNISRVAFLQSVAKTTNIQNNVNGYEEDHCGVHGAQLYDCAYINEVLEMALFVLAIVVVAFFFIYNMVSKCFILSLICHL